MINYCSTTLDANIQGILDVAQASFSHFYSSEQLFARLQDKRSWVYVASVGERIVGFKIWYEQEGQIFSWLGAVHPEYRRRGIASELMRRQISESKAEGYSQITLKTHIGHPEMIELCNKFGFRLIKGDPRHWGDERTALFYELTL